MWYETGDLSLLNFLGKFENFHVADEYALRLSSASAAFNNTVLFRSSTYSAVFRPVIISYYNALFKSSEEYRRHTSERASESNEYKVVIRGERTGTKGV